MSGARTHKGLCAGPGVQCTQPVDDKTKHKEACPESIAPQDGLQSLPNLFRGCFYEDNIHDPRVSDEL